jgi:hypothetical protein
VREALAYVAGVPDPNRRALVTGPRRKPPACRRGLLELRSNCLLCEAMNYFARIRPFRVICAGCKCSMEEKTDKADVIQLRTRTKMVVYECPECGAETERQIAIALH